MNILTKIAIMNKCCQLLCALFLVSCFSLPALAQSVTISGNVKKSVTGESVSAVSVTIKGLTVGTFTDDKGNFKLTTVQNPPFTLVFSSVGFTSKEVAVTNAGQFVQVELAEGASMGEEIVVSASRLPERILESPVTIERVNSATIRNMPAPNFYEGIANLKGVDMSTSSLTFRTLSTRGFNGSGNLRFNQFVDGIDNQAPGLNFSVGNIVGMTELDVDNVELLSGASSALYGSGGMNGTLLMHSKNPFRYQGLSFQVKQGVMHTDGSQRSISPYYDWAVRWGKAFNDKFAFKVSAQYLQARDWQAQDYRNLNRNNVFSSLKNGDRRSDPNYDGVNVYGDQVSLNMLGISNLLIGGATQQYIAAYMQGSGGVPPTQGQIDGFLSTNPAIAPYYLGVKNGIIPNQNVSRTGYEEKDVVDYGTYSVKLSGGLYYKITPKIEASLIGYWGMGTTVYTGLDRYSLRNLKIGQYKLEFKSDNWFVRAYTTQENAGESYNTTALASYINESWKPSLNTANLGGSWYPQYIGAYMQAVANAVPDPHNFARAFADQGRLIPGTDAYKAQYDNIRNRPISQSGALFLDKSDLWQYEGQLNLSKYVKFVDVLVGGNYRQFILNSEGTLFDDATAPIKIDEYGAFVQLQKKLLNDVLKLTGSVRYDKSKNFDGRFTPRVSAVIKIAEDNNIRLSYQQAYRFPSTQNQYIDLFSSNSRLIGGIKSFQEKYNLIDNPGYTGASVVKFRSTLNPADLVKDSYKPINAETSESYEIGYKGVYYKRLLVDIYGYYSRYDNFIANIAVVQPQNQTPAGIAGLVNPSAPFSNNYAYPTNIDNKVNSLGYGISMEYKLYKTLSVNGNFASDELNNVPDDVVTFFNAPKYKFNLGLGDPDICSGFGFNMTYRWQDKVYWEGTFGTGDIPSYGTVDAQVSYRIPKTKNLFKIGASNLLNKYYRSAFGNPDVGGLYYVSFGYNVF